MASYSPATLDEIRAGVDVVDLVGRFVNLRKAGQNYKGLCPFHSEKTPSFMVNPKKGIFHCFGCGVGGDVFGFLMRQDRLSFPEAVRVLAKQAGVALPEDRGGPAAGDSGREELYRVMEAAAAFYTERLWAAGGDRARLPDISASQISGGRLPDEPREPVGSRDHSGRAGRCRDPAGPGVRLAGHPGGQVQRDPARR